MIKLMNRALCDCQLKVADVCHIPVQEVARNSYRNFDCCRNLIVTCCDALARFGLG